MSAREQKIRRWAAGLTPEQALDALVEMTETALDGEVIRLSSETDIPYWCTTGEPVVAGQRPFED